MDNGFICRDFVPGDEFLLAELTREVFSQFVLPHFPPDEAAVFLESQEPRFIHFRFLYCKIFIIVAQDKEATEKRLNRGVAGFIEVRNNKHISLLVVRKECQRQGVARRLICEAVKKCWAADPSLGGITLNATPCARPVYEKLGFEKIDWPAGSPAGNSIPMVLRLG